MKALITTESITRDDLKAIFNQVDDQNRQSCIGSVACSFQGTGTRTRSTFIQSLRRIGLDYVDLPVFLDTSEQIKDLAGYLDSYYDLYIIRYGNHEKLTEFANYSKRPVINAMSAYEHPCEAISDAYWFNTNVKKLCDANIVVWGPITNVLRSWCNVAKLAGAEIHTISNPDTLPSEVDLVITDGWPSDASSGKKLSGISILHLKEMGTPVLLPTPPFTVGQEIDFHPTEYERFAGYEQKACLIDVQEGIIRWLLQSTSC